MPTTTPKQKINFRLAPDVLDMAEKMSGALQTLTRLQVSRTQAIERAVREEYWRMEAEHPELFRKTVVPV